MITNMQNKSGNPVKNQFIITDYESETFQSYQTVICRRFFDERKTILDRNNWNYSVTTSKYRNLFLNETTAETTAKIKSGEYELADLNK